MFYSTALMPLKIRMINAYLMKLVQNWILKSEVSSKCIFMLYRTPLFSNVLCVHENHLPSHESYMTKHHFKNYNYYSHLVTQILYLIKSLVAPKDAWFNWHT